MRILKIVLGLFILALAGAVAAALTKAFRSSSSTTKSPLSYDTWPTVPRKPAATTA